jgi:hypothetical protein
LTLKHDNQIPIAFVIVMNVITPLQGPKCMRLKVLQFLDFLFKGFQEKPLDVTLMVNYKIYYKGNNVPFKKSIIVNLVNLCEPIDLGSNYINHLFQINCVDLKIQFKVSTHPNLHPYN